MWKQNSRTIIMVIALVLAAVFGTYTTCVDYAVTAFYVGKIDMPSCGTLIANMDNTRTLIALLLVLGLTYVATPKQQ